LLLTPRSLIFVCACPWQAWQRPDIPIDVQYLKSLRREKRDIPVRLVLERRIKMMLLELPPRRFCRYVCACPNLGV
jgi:hypothetical protein